jgi:alginate O-acetyltransferase complex protein AlgI
MQFTSLAFFAFFAAVFATYRLPLRWRARKWILVVWSCVFYAAWNPVFLPLLLLSTLVDWEVGKRLYVSQAPSRRRLLLTTSLVANLGLLAYFKYAGFALENLAALARLLGIPFTPEPFEVLLPIGISFYTFQTLCYSLDIYRGHLKPCESFVDYALSVTFFPQLVAGPIVRPSSFLPQCVQPPLVTREALAWGGYLFVIGLFQKSVVADGLLAPGVERIFQAQAAPSALTAWTGCLGAATRVYCDFAGYSLCAIGLGKCFGFELPPNFRFPFGAVGFQDFWRRWHMSLSTWLRDYVYVPLQRGGGWHWISTVLIIWLLIGLWHGAAWGFVLWGLASGCLLVVERVLRSVVPEHRLWSTAPVRFALAALTFLAFCSTIPFFWLPEGDRMWLFMRALFFGGSEAAPLLKTRGSLLIVGTALTMFVAHYALRDTSLEEIADRLSWPVRAVLLAAMLLAISLVREADRAFIYFQF